MNAKKKHREENKQSEAVPLPNAAANTEEKLKGRAADSSAAAGKSVKAAAAAEAAADAEKRTSPQSFGKEFLDEFHGIQSEYGIPEEAEETVPEEELDSAPDTGEDAKKPKNGIPDYECLFTETGGGGNAGARILKRIFEQNFGKIVMSTILMLIKNAAVWALPVITANIINCAANPTPHTQRDILLNVLVLIILIVQNFGSHMLYAKYTNKLLRTIGAGLRNTLIRKIQHLSITYHKEIETGRIQAKFMRDIEAIEFFNMHFLKSLIPAILNVIVSVCISVSKSGIVTLFFLCVVPINVSAVYIFRRKMAKNNRSFRHESENISAKVSTMMDMLPVTKAHGLESKEISSVSRNIRTLYEKGLTLDKTNDYFSTVSWIISQCISAMCLLFTSYLAIKGKIQVGDIVMFQSYFGAISNGVQSVLNIYPELAKGVESVRSVSEIMLSNDIEDNKGKLKLRYVHGSVEFRHVYYRYPNTEKDIIKDFSLNVKQGECVAFVGSSGSGKSTIMNMIIGFLKATGGEILIDGKPIDALNLSAYRHFISVVPQTSVLFPGTIRENILYGTDNVSEEEFRRVLEEANINEFLPTLENGVDTMVGESGNKLSGGQKQRISIARALIRDPRILILDEATSALDNISEYQVQKAISHLIKERTTFIVAHRLSTIRDADRIVVMDEGRCVEMGTFDELMAKKGKFYELKKLSELGAGLE